MAHADQIGKRIAIASMAIGTALAISKILIGYWANSAAVISDGLESASDVLASGFVLLGLSIAAKPADDNHPYGHGRFETLSGLAVGIMLAVTGTGICVRAFGDLGVQRTPAAFAIWPLIASTILKSGMSVMKFRVGKRIRSDALVADGWNDGIDILSGLTALAAVSLAIISPARFGRADHYGAIAIGLIVIFLGIRVINDTTLQLTDIMPDRAKLDEIRNVALQVPGALGIEKCYARKTGLQYHVDLHLEVDPELTVRRSHYIAHAVRERVLTELDWVADVLVHVEPHAAATIESGPEWRIGK